MKVRTFTFAAIAALIFTACGAAAPSAPSVATPIPTLDSAVFAFTGDTPILQPGTTMQAGILGIFTNGTARDITSSCGIWLSSDPSVLSVNDSGLIKAHQPSGSALVTTVCQNVSAEALLTVDPLGTALPPDDVMRPKPPASLACSNGPYTITQDKDGRKHCREAKTGRFALDACCGI